MGLKALQTARFGGWTVTIFHGYASALDSGSPYFLTVECPPSLGIRKGRYVTTQLRMTGFQNEQGARDFGNKVWQLAKNGGSMADLMNLTQTS